MVLGFHFILSAYGFWLSNDPRGSWSTAIRQFDLLAFGPATKTDTTRSVADKPHDRAARERAKRAMKHSPVRFTGRQAQAVGHGFADAAAEAGYAIHALAVLPDHAHLVIRRHNRPVHRIAAHLKAKATARLTLGAMHPLAQHASPAGRVPSPWARNYWCPFIDSVRQMREAIDYVENNPAKAGLPRQRWKVVVPYDA